MEKMRIICVRSNMTALLLDGIFYTKRVNFEEFWCNLLHLNSNDYIFLNLFSPFSQSDRKSQAEIICEAKKKREENTIGAQFELINICFLFFVLLFYIDILAQCAYYTKK